MPKIKDQKLLYHLTSIKNFSSILQKGILPRSQLDNFKDVADPDIIADRKNYQLENYVPFHWFARNPFDGRVQSDHPNTDFILISVRRAIALKNNWLVIPRHPLAHGIAPQILNYTDGVNSIDWDVMDVRDYRNPDCKSICMAECLSPTAVSHRDFFKIFVPNNRVENKALEIINEFKFNIEVVINAGMFIK